ncbi:hypothetical protein [Bradyrhizobium sp. WSM1417]|uniref:hypothetical protein n=1 Tax=Bradyrhizobium sp. WSM1417 TaxID=754500 RepID=UPI0012EC6164|nr:hypothetical protein [Bradyrhizobium sp. WSM1417]
MGGEHVGGVDCGPTSIPVFAASRTATSAFVLGASWRPSIVSKSFTSPSFYWFIVDIIKESLVMDSMVIVTRHIDEIDDMCHQHG